MHLDTIFLFLSLCLSSVLLYLGVRLSRHSYNRIRFYQTLQQRGQQVVGKVNQLREEPSTLDGDTATFPIITYQVNGQTYEAEPHAFMYESFTIGQEINVRFLPENPVDCTWRKTAIVEIMMFFIGTCCVVITSVHLMLQFTALLKAVN